jgi:hypothetical protein
MDLRVRVCHDPKMPLLTELEFLWEWVFYRDVAPTALGFASKFTSAPFIRFATVFRSKALALGIEPRLKSPPFGGVTHHLFKKRGSILMDPRID